MKENNNQVIYYTNGKAIVKDDYENLYYLEIEEKDVELGCSISPSSLKPFTDLTESEQSEIRLKIQK